MTAFTANIGASSDDAREAPDTTVVINGANITFIAANTYAGLRFTNVTIPNGATINSASLTLDVSSTAYDDPDVTIYANDTDDAATFTTSSTNISGRALTTASAAWSATGIGSGAKTSPDFASVIKEIVDRAGWASGNDIAIILKSNSANNFRFNTYDNPSTITLNIDYTAGGGGSTQPPRSMHQFRQRGL